MTKFFLESLLSLDVISWTPNLTTKPCLSTTTMLFCTLPWTQLWPQLRCPQPPPLKYCLHAPWRFWLSFFSWDFESSVSVPVCYRWYTTENEQLTGSRTQKSCFLYALQLWGGWCEIYRLVEKQKSLCWILWLFHTCLKILNETISFYTIAWVQAWRLVAETAGKKAGVCPRLGTNLYSSSLPQHLFWPHWSHIKEWGYLFTYLIGCCKECESWQRLGLESTMLLAKERGEPCAPQS